MLVHLPGLEPGTLALISMISRRKAVVPFNSWKESFVLPVSTRFSHLEKKKALWRQLLPCCQNTDTDLDIQHYLITSDKKGQAITHRYSGNNNGYGQEKRMYGQQQWYSGNNENYIGNHILYQKRYLLKITLYLIPFQPIIKRVWYLQTNTSTQDLCWKPGTGLNIQSQSTMSRK